MLSGFEEKRLVSNYFILNKKDCTNSRSGGHGSGMWCELIDHHTTQYSVTILFGFRNRICNRDKINKSTCASSPKRCITTIFQPVLLKILRQFSAQTTEILFISYETLVPGHQETSVDYKNCYFRESSQQLQQKCYIFFPMQRVLICIS